MLGNIVLKIFNMSIAADIIILAVLAARVFLRKAPKVFSYALWGIVLFRLLCPFALSSPVSVFRLVRTPINNSAEIQFLAQNTEALPITQEAQREKGADAAASYERDLHDPMPYVPTSYDPATPGDFGRNPEEEAGNFQDVLLKSPEALQQGPESQNNIPQSSLQQSQPASEANELPAAESAESHAANPHTLEIVQSILAVVWLVGMLLLLIIHGIRFVQIKRKVAISMRLRDNIFLCDEIAMPFCLGIVKPGIYLPSSLGESERVYIILHEQHHIKRLDHLWKLFAFAALCIHWFNPLVWLAFVLAGKDMEMSCDEAVMRKMSDDIRAEYAATLLQLATGRKIFAASLLAFGEGDPGQRIKNIMNYKRPGLRVIVPAAMGCMIVAICLGTNPQSALAGEADGAPESSENASQENASPENDPGVEDHTTGTENTAIVSEETETHTGEVDFYAAYYTLIDKAMEVLKNPEIMEESPENYLDSEGNQLFSDEFRHDTREYQVLGFLLKDVDGDGIKELLFGENDVHPDGGWNGIVYDMYTIRDGQLIHVLDGWPRYRFYLTKKGEIVNEWSSSAMEHGYAFYQFNGEKLVLTEKVDIDTSYESHRIYMSDDMEKEISETEVQALLEQYEIVYPYFIPMGSKWEEVDDIDGDGQAETVIYSEEDGGYWRLTFLLDGEKIYEHDDPCEVEIGDLAAYVDLDHDGEEEILLTMYPRVNSMPLTEYAVLKRTDGEWRKLEMYAGEDILDNSFPVTVTKGEGKYEAVIFCAGLDKHLSFDMEKVYSDWKASAEAENGSLARDIVNHYDYEILQSAVGEECGSTCDWGVWDIQLSSYEGKPCLIAEQGIQGYGRNDFWGSLFIRFDYDREGKIRILDMDFTPRQQTTTDNGNMDPELVRQIKVFAENWDFLHNPAYEEPANEQFTLVDLNHDGKLELFVSEAMGTGKYTYSNVFRVADDGSGIQQLTTDIRMDFSEPDLIQEWLTMYTDPASGRSYYMTWDTLRIESREYYDTLAAIYLSDDGESLCGELIAQEHATYHPEKHEYFDSDGKSISGEAYGKLLTDYFADKSYLRSNVHFTWIARERTRGASTDEIEKLLAESYDGFRKVAGDVDLDSFSVTGRFDPESRRFYFACQGVETKEGFDINPYWDYVVQTQVWGDIEDKDSLYYRYSELFKGNLGEEEYPGKTGEGSTWDVHVVDSSSGFVAVASIYGFEDLGYLDYWGQIEIYFVIDDHQEKQIQDIYFRPSTNMARLNGNYAGEDYMDAYREIMKAYSIFDEKMDEEADLQQAYLAVGSSYICEEYAAVAGAYAEPVYLIDDINEDGVPELFLGARRGEDSTYIYDVYTWKDGLTYQLLRGIGYRNGSCILCEDGLIKNVYDYYGNEWELLFQRLPQYGTDLETVETIQATPREGNSDAVEIRYQGEVISQADAQRIIDSHKEREVSFEENQ